MRKIKFKDRKGTHNKIEREKELRIENKLKRTIESFELKIIQAEEEYKKKNKGDIDKEKMSKYVNRKLKKEINLLNIINLHPYALVYSEKRGKGRLKIKKEGKEISIKRNKDFIF